MEKGWQEPRMHVAFVPQREVSWEEFERLLPSNLRLIVEESGMTIDLTRLIDVSYYDVNSGCPNTLMIPICRDDERRNGHCSVSLRFPFFEVSSAFIPRWSLPEGSRCFQVRLTTDEQAFLVVWR